MTKTLIEMTPETSWFKANGYELISQDKNGTGEVWSNTKTGEWIILSKNSTWTTVFFPSTGEFRQFPTEYKTKKTYEWTKKGVDKAIRAAFTEFPQWGTTFQVAETYNTENDTWGVTWQKAGESYTAWITKKAVTTGDVAWIASQFAKSPVLV